jgi:FkbM family methyltransferase
VSRFDGLVVRCEQFFGEFPLAARLSAKVRNACNRVIGYHLAPTPSPEQNGEFLLLDMLAPLVTSFIDVGANMGEWSARLLVRSSGRVKGVLVEPGADAHRALQTRFGEDVRIMLSPVALGERTESLVFYDEPGGGETSSLVPGFSRGDAVQRIVPCMTLDELALMLGFSSVDLVKIDVEGMDLQVIRGAKSLLRDKAIGFLQFEYNRPWARAGNTLGEALAFLGNHEYEVFVITPRGLEQPRHEIFGEYFEYSNYLAVLKNRRGELASLLR